MGVSPKIAVLALQGDFERHITRLRELGANAYPARSAHEVDEADGVILPGGESTTIGKLLTRYEIDKALGAAHEAGKPIYGTCAGLILMAKRIDAGSGERGGQPILGLLDVHVERNAYGRQIDSFEVILDDSHLAGTEDDGMNLEAVFIRAPAIVEQSAAVKTLASYCDQPVLVQEGSLLASSFHPELTNDTRVHQYFLAMTAQRHEK